MKVLLRLLSLALLASAITLLMNCGGKDPEPKSEYQIQFEKLTPPTWVLAPNGAVFEETPNTDFVDVTLKLGGTFNKDNSKAVYTFQFTGEFPDLSPWPKTGTWRFGADPNSQIVRLDDDQNINYTLTDTQLILRMQPYAGPGWGRVSQVNGEWEFTFNKQ